MRTEGTLVFFCGKMAAGKSTLATRIVERTGAILLVQDEWLGHLFPDEIVDVDAYRKYSGRLSAALTEHVGALLGRGIDVVLDFPANTRRQRAWFRELIDRTGPPHELHFVDAPDALCKAQLRERSRDLAEGTAWTTDAEFDAITRFFEPPSADEDFHIVRHVRKVPAHV
ncbi:ATP-binding protein [Candidatus Binatia bacterium]|jgi:predicted kinase|nr:ATP-binding protein [Candidatus Binatia bacterium]